MLKAGRKHFALEAEELRSVRKNDWRKAAMAELLQAETTVRRDWIADRLAPGTRSGCCRLIKENPGRTEEKSRVEKSGDGDSEG